MAETTTLVPPRPTGSAVSPMAERGGENDAPLPCCLGRGPCQAPPDIGPCDPPPTAENDAGCPPARQTDWHVAIHADSDSLFRHDGALIVCQECSVFPPGKTAGGPVDLPRPTPPASTERGTDA